MARRTITMLAATLLLAAPAATATWMAYGTHEPDTALDQPSFLPFDPPGAAAKKVYFNGWTAARTNDIPGFGIHATNGVNPNVGLVGTRNEVGAEEVFTAILGVWSDCNQDGYIGMAETAVREYESALLTDTSICPPRTGGVQKWQGQHNYNGWVSEYIPIGHSGGDTEDDLYNLRIYRDADARVWGDLGRPTDPASAGGTICPLTAPRGSFATTGGILNFLDCHTSLLEAWNAAAPADMRFADDDDARQDGHPLHMGTFGSEDSSESAAYVADCDADPLVRVNMTETVDNTDLEEIAGQPIGTLNGFEFTQQPLSPRLGGSQSPTAPATLNMTLEEGVGDCDYGNDDGRDFYGNVEGDTAYITSENKRAAQINFAFTDSSRGGREPNGNLLGNSAWSVLHGGAAGMSNDAGVGLGGDWNGNLRLVKTGPRVVRSNVAEEPGIADAQHVTYYAVVGENITAGGFLLPGGSGIYGSAQCGSQTSGVFNGWNCDRDAWYIAPDGNPLPGTATFARPGDAYLLRDVDCHDGGNSFGVPLGAPALGGGACLPPN